MAETSDPDVVWDCIVVGGGPAGISAAVDLADAGLRILLVDNRHYLGGRASSFPDPVSGEILDACQHITLGCCTALDGLLNRLGVADRVRYLPEVHFSLPDGHRVTLSASGLPAPYHLLPSLLRAPGLGFADKLSAARLLRMAMQWASDRRKGAAAVGEAAAFADTCRLARLTDAARELLIEPVVLSACNAQLEEVADSYGLMVLYEALCATRQGYRLGIPTVPLAELFTEPVQRYLGERGSQVQVRVTVKAVQVDESGIVVVKTSSGREIRGRRCVVAVPWHALSRVLSSSLLTPQQQECTGVLQPSPIVGTHLWLDRPVDMPDTLCLLGCRTHWVFHKDRNFRRGGTHGAHLATVTSADRTLAAMEPARIAQLALEEIRQRVPGATEARLVRWRCVREYRATFIPAPGVDNLRPLHRTRRPEVVIAGDWTATGWPATMEGAVRSGELAARALLTDTLT